MTRDSYDFFRVHFGIVQGFFFVGNDEVSYQMKEGESVKIEYRIERKRFGWEIWM